MRRVNIQAAFMGEGGESDSGDEEGVALSVRGGELIVVIPAGTSDDKVLASATTVRGSLRMENGRVFQFEIQDGAVGAFFEDERTAFFDRREAAEGLSSLSADTERPSFGGAAALKGASVTARDIMHTDVVTISADQSVDEAARLLDFHRISGMPVMQGERVIGMLSEADLIGKSGSVVAQVMSAPAITVPSTMLITDLATRLTEKSIRRVPVLDEQHKLVGVVSRADVLRWAAQRVHVTEPMAGAR